MNTTTMTPAPMAATENTAKSEQVHRHWPTWGAMALCLLIWGVALILPQGWTAVQLAALVFALTLHSSLSHEILHGGLFRKSWANSAVGIVQPGLFVPYLRFRALHLAHHRDESLTDPYDDPETNYLDPAVWLRLGVVPRAILRFNNTLLGRMAIGPLIGMVYFLRSDLRRAAQGERDVVWHWLAHMPGTVLTLWLVDVSTVSVWVYVAACYGAMSVLRIRTFLEHRAYEKAQGRTVVIEGRGLLSFLFLNNNFHMVHHLHPKVAWYRLPALYRAQRAQFLRCNDGYVYRSYGAVFARYFLRAKDPVAHPLWRGPRD